MINYEDDFSYLSRILDKTPDKELVYQTLLKTIKNDEYMCEHDKQLKLLTLSKAYEAVMKNSFTKK